MVYARHNFGTVKEGNKSVPSEAVNTWYPTQVAIESIAHLSLQIEHRSSHLYLFCRKKKKKRFLRLLADVSSLVLCWFCMVTTSPLSSMKALPGLQITYPMKSAANTEEWFVSNTQRLHRTSEDMFIKFSFSSFCNWHNHTTICQHSSLAPSMTKIKSCLHPSTTIFGVLKSSFHLVRIWKPEKGNAFVNIWNYHCLH